MTGYGNFKNHPTKIKIEDADICRLYLEEVVTVEHIVSDYPALGIIRPWIADRNLKYECHVKSTP